MGTKIRSLHGWIRLAVVLSAISSAVSFVLTLVLRDTKPLRLFEVLEFDSSFVPIVIAILTAFAVFIAVTGLGALYTRTLPWIRDGFAVTGSENYPWKVWAVIGLSAIGIIFAAAITTSIIKHFQEERSGAKRMVQLAERVGRMPFAWNNELKSFLHQNRMVDTLWQQQVESLSVSLDTLRSKMMERLRDVSLEIHELENIQNRLGGAKKLSGLTQREFTDMQRRLEIAKASIQRVYSRQWTYFSRVGKFVLILDTAYVPNGVSSRVLHLDETFSLEDTLRLGNLLTSGKDVDALRLKELSQQLMNYLRYNQ